MDRIFRFDLSILIRCLHGKEGNLYTSECAEHFKKCIKSNNLNDVYAQISQRFPGNEHNDGEIQNWILFHTFLGKILSYEEMELFITRMKNAPTCTISRRSKERVLLNLGICT